MISNKVPPTIDQVVMDSSLLEAEWPSIEDVVVADSCGFVLQGIGLDALEGPFPPSSSMISVITCFMILQSDAPP